MVLEDAADAVEARNAGGGEDVDDARDGEGRGDVERDQLRVRVLGVDRPRV